MTPFEIDILFHYYARGIDHEVVLNNPPVWKETRQWFLEAGLLRNVERITMPPKVYEITERGTAWCEYVCALPIPEQAWKMPAVQP